ncbi:MAG TPA: toxin-antitoxin system, antitoxin component, Xre family protein [Gammaproteobacteria bacterium]|nr:toxin-antitoxin system, antitoxin component, Xre family protein [Gammaproteobacteria bacterium]
MHTHSIDQAVAKLKLLPPERVAEVEDFIDFISQRRTSQALTQAAQATSEPVLEKIWGNKADAEYDQL